MTTSQEKYLRDPKFHALVDTFVKFIIDCEVTPSILLEAANFASLFWNNLSKNGE